MFKVIITKYTVNTLWYRDRIDEVFAIQSKDNLLYVKYNINNDAYYTLYSPSIYIIFVEDCILLDEEEIWQE